MRTSFRHLLALAALAVVVGAAPAAHAVPRPELSFGFGSTLGVSGTPDGGGIALSLAPMWPVNDRVAFGVNLFADDIGTTMSTLRDPNSGDYLGRVATAHRWTWGGAWRGDVNVMRVHKWDADMVGQWGYWRLEDDQRGAITGAVSAVGFSLGADLHHHLSGPQAAGLSLRYHRLFTDRSVAVNRLDHYASLALSWRWAGTKP